MNKWIEKSISLANSHGYLDELIKVYPVSIEEIRDVSDQEREKIHKAFSSKNSKELINVLLDFKKFPIDDPYIGFLRKDRKALNKNPKTIKRIGNRLFHLGYEGIISGVGKPKSPSRQMGQMFKNWLPNLGFPILLEKEFLAYKGVAILKGGDEALMKFAKNEIGYTRKKGLDLVLKTKKNFVIGEAKLITTNGGTQDKSFREAINFVKTKNKNAISIAVLDGVVWIPNNKNGGKKSLYDSLTNLNNKQIVLSSLLLNDFIKSLE